jgi:hypothetical protein
MFHGWVEAHEVTAPVLQRGLFVAHHSASKGFLLGADQFAGSCEGKDAKGLEPGILAPCRNIVGNRMASRYLIDKLLPLG